MTSWLRLTGPLAAIASPTSLTMESSQDLATRVNRLTKAGANVKPLPELAPSGGKGVQLLTVRPIALLHSIGLATAVPSLDVATLRLSGRWAIARYVWAFARTPSGQLRMSAPSNEVFHHQRQLMSEHMAIGLATWVMAQRLTSPPSGMLDADWLARHQPSPPPQLAAGFSARKPWPDYFFPVSAASLTFHVVECKGTSGHRSSVVRQFAERAISQVIGPTASIIDRRVMFGCCIPRGSRSGKTLGIPRGFALEVDMGTSPGRQTSVIHRRQLGRGAAERLACSQLLSFAGQDASAEYVSPWRQTALEDVVRSNAPIPTHLRVGALSDSYELSELRVGGDRGISIFTGLATDVATSCREGSLDSIAARWSRRTNLAAQLEYDPERGQLWFAETDGTVVGIQAST
jgi:hypothetical protein